jgi:hypothetical protein
MKHVGKMKNNGAKIVIVYRTLPGDPLSALVVGTNGLGDTYHDALMNLVQDNSGQQANELADILSVRKFPDGNNMLEALHNRGNLKKVPTSGVLVTPDTQTTIPLDELNIIIAEQKGVSIEELAITDGKTPNKKTASVKKAPEVVQVEEIVLSDDMSATALRSKADALFKQAQQLRKQADALDPPKSKAKKVSVEVE